MFRGDNVFAEADKANEEAKSRSQHSASQNRFYLPPGKEAEIIVLDDKISIGMFEHDLDIPGKKYKKYVPCIASIPGMTCPLCRAGDKRTYRMFASVLDLTEYTTGKGTVVKRRKRLLAINQGDKERWQAICQDTIKLHGTMRGTYIYMKRPNEQRSSRIGEPFAIEGRLWQHMDANELVKSYGHKAVVENGKVLRPANDDITPLDYGTIFPYPDEEFVAKMEADYGNGVPAARADDAEAGETARSGSAADIDSAWDEEIQEGHPEDEIPGLEQGGGEEAPSVEGLGEVADSGDQEAAQTLTEVAQGMGIDVEAYGSWAEVEAAIAEQQAPEPEPEPEPVKPKLKPMLRKPGTPAPAAPAKPVARPGIARPGGITRPAAATPAATPAKKLAIKRPGGPAPASPAPKPGLKPGGLVRPNRGAFGE